MRPALSGELTRRRLCAAGLVALGATVGACGGGKRAPLQELPVQIGHGLAPTRVPAPTPQPTPTPDCTEPPVQVVSYALEGPANASSRTIAGQIKTSCQSPIVGRSRSTLPRTRRFLMV